MIIMMMMITLHCLMSRTLFTNIPMSSTPQNRQNLITYCACPRLLRENNANRIQTKVNRTGNADWKFLDRMMLFDSTRGANNYKIRKIVVLNIFQTDGEQTSEITTSSNGVRMRWPNFTVV